jgi:hypothetical protein
MLALLQLSLRGSPAAPTNTVHIAKARYLDYSEQDASQSARFAEFLAQKTNEITALCDLKEQERRLFCAFRVDYWRH